MDCNLRMSRVDLTKKKKKTTTYQQNSNFQIALIIIQNNILTLQFQLNCSESSSQLSKIYILAHIYNQIYNCYIRVKEKYINEPKTYPYENYY